MELEKQNAFERSFHTESGTSENATDEDTRPLDLRPEFCRYRDEGCELAESCLNCPFARCIYDEPGGNQGRMKRVRDKEIVRLRRDERKKLKELSEMFGVSERTVQRALKAMRGGKERDTKDSRNDRKRVVSPK